MLDARPAAAAHLLCLWLTKNRNPLCTVCLSVACIAAVQSQADAGSKARKQLQDLLSRKAEVITKLQVLQQELEMAQNLNPEGEPGLRM